MRTSHRLPGGRLLLALAVAASGTACTDHWSSSAAPPTRICGRTLDDSPAGAVVTDVSSQGRTVTGVTVGDVIYLRLASGCRSGASIAVDPPGAATIVNSVKASDGRLTAVVLRPVRDDFSVRVTRSRSSVSVVTVALDIGGQQGGAEENGPSTGSADSAPPTPAG